MTSLATLNQAPAPELIVSLLACCEDHGWAETVTAGRPYADEPALLARAGEAYDALSPAEVAHIIATHPRLGAPPTGADRASSWSREEAAGIQSSDELRDVQLEYERRFGRIFLIAAAGLSKDAVIAAARRRLEYDDATDLAESVAQLRRIVLSRLQKVIS